MNALHLQSGPLSSVGAVTLQTAYDNSGVAQPKIALVPATGPVTIRDAAAPIGDVFILENNAGVDFLNVDPLQMNFGVATQRLFEATNIIGGYGGFVFYPDDFTATSLVVQDAFQWTSTLTSAVPGGAPLGNDFAPNFVNWRGEVILTEQGGLFNTQSLFSQGTTITCQGANTGPIYTMINQPVLRTGSAGGSRTGSQQNAVRSQLRVGPNIAGNFALTSHETFFAFCSVDGTVGTASIGTVNYFAAKAPGLIAGGTIGALTLYDLPAIPAAGITTLIGIRSAMSAGTFLSHTGTAPADFTNAAFRMGFVDNAGIELGTGNDVLLNVTAANELEFAFAAFADDIRFSNPSNGRFLIQGNAGIAATGDEFNLACRAFTLGAQTGAIGNGVGQFVAGTRTTQIGGEWSDFLLTQAAALTVNIAGMNVFGWTVNAPSITLSGAGTVGQAGVLNIGGNVNQGSVDRFGVRILSNPTGGSGINAALWVTAGLSRFDGRVDINRPIALGGGAAATLGTIGGAGPTAAAQAQWVEIDIAGVAHWIPAWT